jgi:aminodeoxyfutalosine synthase
MTALEGLAERVAAGGETSSDDARLLLETPDLITVGMIADDLRRRLHGSETTFVRVFEVEVDAPAASLPPNSAAGEIRVVGVPPSIEAAEGAVRAARALAGAIPVFGFALADLVALSPSIEETFARLRAAGLDGIAEVQLDRTPDVASAIVLARSNGLEVLRLTVHTLQPGDRLKSVERASELQRAVGGLRAFAPLPRQVDVAAPTTGYDDVKLVAAARVMAGNIPSIQVDWVGYGPKLAQVALTMGADDVDGIVAVEPGLLGTRRSALEEIRGNIRAAGLDGRERNGRFEPLAS